ncbi:MAG TPA: hypothetical protein VL295_10470 [Gemmatimonadales bacterium]|nr:hypothetical protein [Gemmatimonadales bacterium]
MSHLPAIPEVILLDFLPKPGELQGLISDRLPGLVTQPAPRRKPAMAEHHSTPMGRVEGFILLDFLPPLGALEGVIRGHRTGATPRPQGAGHY